MKIRKYNDFVNEEINLKKAIATGAMAASLAACGPNDSTNRVNNLPNVDRVEQAEVAKDFNDLPNNFDMDQELITIGMDMEITSGGDVYGKVEERTLSWGRTFELFDASNKKIATAKQEVFSLYTLIKIKDESGKILGSIEEEVLESLFSLYSIYSIKDAHGKIIGKSEKLDFFTTQVDIYDNSGNLLVSLDKAFMSIGDSWSVKNNGGLDNKIVTFIPAFISAAQADRQAEEDEKNK